MVKTRQDKKSNTWRGLLGLSHSRLLVTLTNPSSKCHSCYVLVVNDVCRLLTPKVCETLALCERSLGLDHLARQSMPRSFSVGLYLLVTSRPRHGLRQSAAASAPVDILPNSSEPGERYPRSVYSIQWRWNLIKKKPPESDGNY